MVITRTPYRISFFGGGTDYPEWIREHGGAVVATSIDKYCYLTCRHLPPFFEHRYRIVYSRIEDCLSVDQIQHPAVRAVLQDLQVTQGIELHHDGDLPARSGMGSSSSFVVGLLNAVRALNGRISSKELLARESIRIEQDVMQERVGCQDQLTAAYGGFNRFTFRNDGEFEVQPLTLDAQRTEALQSRLMLMYTGIRRTASDVANSYVGDLLTRTRQQHRMRAMVDEAIDILNSDAELDFFGELLHEAWQMKRSLGSRISSPYIDEIYEAARRAGAQGGKLLGAGGGGFMLLFAPLERQQEIRKTLHDLIQAPFRFENSGSQVVFYDPQQRLPSNAQDESTHPRRRFRERVDESTKGMHTNEHD